MGSPNPISAGGRCGLRQTTLSMSMSIKIFSMARIAELLQVHGGAVESQKDCEKENVFKRWRKTGRDGDDWMSDGSEVQRSDAATGNVRRPTVVAYCSLF